MESYRVYLKEIHWQEVHVHADSRQDAVKRARDGEGDYIGATTYHDKVQDVTEHRVEEI